jgi:hypothetical protein
MNNKKYTNNLKQLITNIADHTRTKTIIINSSTIATVGMAMQQHLTNKTTTIRSKLIYGPNISLQSHETSSPSYYSETCLIKKQYF